MTGERAAEIVDQAFGGYYSEWSGTMTKAEIDEFKEVCDMAMKAVTEEAIPVDWINRFLAWLGRVNNDMSLRDAKGIRVMLAQWRTGRYKFDAPEGCGGDSCDISK